MLVNVRNNEIGLSIAIYYYHVIGIVMHMGMQPLVIIGCVLDKHIAMSLATFFKTLIFSAMLATKYINIESSKLSSKEYLQFPGAFLMAFIFYPNRFYKRRKLCMLIGR